MRFLVYLSFLSLFTFLLLPTTFALLGCPNDPPPPSLNQDQFIVFLKPPNLIGIVLDLVDHVLLLVTCLGREIVSLVPGEGLFGDGPIDPNKITDLSILGTGFR